jgi:opacity protein-like surface antigen
MEFALSDRWSAKAEYMHYELGKKDFDQGSIGQPESSSTRGDSVLVGVNYHLGALR